VRSQNSAIRQLDRDAQGRPAEGSLQAPRPAIEGFAAAQRERNDRASQPPLLPHQPPTVTGRVEPKPRRA
jgi:hypothetical protein